MESGILTDKCDLDGFERATILLVVGICAMDYRCNIRLAIRARIGVGIHRAGIETIGLLGASGPSASLGLSSK